MLFGACSENAIIHPPDIDNNGDYIIVHGSVCIPPPTTALTRGMSHTPDYGALKLYVFEFDYTNRSSLENMVTAVCPVSDESVQEGYVSFKLTLQKTDAPKVLHLVAVNRNNPLDLSNVHGSAGNFMPSLVTTGDNEAYWAQVIFETGYDSETDVISKLTRISMVRNFAQISVNNNALDQFKFEGLAIVNVPNSGTVAPWNTKEMKFPKYTVTETYHNLDYGGITPKGMELNDTTASALKFDPYITSRFMYERPFNSIRHTYAIVKGTYLTPPATSRKSTYYKVDLGWKDANNIFHYYDIIRNFNYIININGVAANGYDSAEEAMRGIVYNNFSFDVHTQKMLNISDAKDMIWVSDVTLIVTRSDDRELSFKYCYKENIMDNGGVVNNTIKDGETGDNNALLTFIKGENWDNIVTGYKIADTDDDGWRTITFTTTEPDVELKGTDFTIINPASGLGRKVDIVVRKPWKITFTRVFGGNYNSPSQFPYGASNGDVMNGEPDRPGWNLRWIVSEHAQSPLTIFFRIPDDVPEALFPLTFELEANRQNIENNKIGTLLQTSGPSFFDNVQGYRIKYQKTISWEDYNMELDESKANYRGTIVPEYPNSDKKVHRIRCRFLTITSLEALGVAQYTTTIVKIRNPYFTDENGKADAEVTFIRRKNRNSYATDSDGSTYEQYEDNNGFFIRIPDYKY